MQGRTACDACVARSRGYTRKRNWSQAGILASNGDAFTQLDYDALFEAQGGRCACRGCETNGKAFDVDHAHGPDGRGPARALVCAYCNRNVIAGIEDRERTLYALAYIVRYDLDRFAELKRDIEAVERDVEAVLGELAATQEGA